MSVTPDPVAEPQAYQAHLLGLLANEDPAAVQERTEAALRALVEAAGGALRTRPEPKEWSVLECVAHVVDAELVYASRYRWIIAHDQPPLLGYDQDLWVDRLAHNDDDPQSLLEAFRVLRAGNLALWRRSTPEQRARVGMHTERGPESFELSFKLIAGHDLFHLAQARATLDAVR